MQNTRSYRGEVPPAARGGDDARGDQRRAVRDQEPPAPDPALGHRAPAPAGAPVRSLGKEKSETVLKFSPIS